MPGVPEHGAETRAGPDDEEYEHLARVRAKVRRVSGPGRALSGYKADRTNQGNQ